MTCIKTGCRFYDEPTNRILNGDLQIVDDGQYMLTGVHQDGVNTPLVHPHAVSNEDFFVSGSLRQISSASDWVSFEATIHQITPHSLAFVKEWYGYLASSCPELFDESSLAA